jgi:hypothetical protein
VVAAVEGGWEQAHKIAGELDEMHVELAARENWENVLHTPNVEEGEEVVEAVPLHTLAQIVWTESLAVGSQYLLVVQRGRASGIMHVAEADPEELRGRWHCDPFPHLGEEWNTGR